MSEYSRRNVSEDSSEAGKLSTQNLIAGDLLLLFRWYLTLLWTSTKSSRFATDSLKFSLTSSACDWGSYAYPNTSNRLRLRPCLDAFALYFRRWRVLPFLTTNVNFKVTYLSGRASRLVQPTSPRSQLLRPLHLPSVQNQSGVGLRARPSTRHISCPVYSASWRRIHGQGRGPLGNHRACTSSHQGCVWT